MSKLNFGKLANIDFHMQDLIFMMLIMAHEICQHPPLIEQSLGAAYLFWQKKG